MDWNGIAIPTTAPTMAFNTNPVDLAVKWPCDLKVGYIQLETWNLLCAVIMEKCAFIGSGGYSDENWLLGIPIILSENVPANRLRMVQTDHFGRIIGVADGMVLKLNVEGLG